MFEQCSDRKDFELCHHIAYAVCSTCAIYIACMGKQIEKSITATIAHTVATVKRTRKNNIPKKKKCFGAQCQNTLTMMVEN